MKNIAFILLLPFFQALGQEYRQDYVITLRLDTLRGDARILTYDLIDRIQIADPTGKKSFTANQVREVSIQNMIYRPVRTETTVMIMKLVTPGFLSLYMGHAPKASVFENPYLVKIGGQSLEVPNLSFKKLMTEFLAECNPVREQIKEGKLGRRDLDEIIRQFNECVASPTITKIEVAPDASNDPRLPALAALTSKLEKDNALPTKKDALDILNDITTKVRSNQNVPNYLLEGLKSQLKDAGDYQQELEKVLEVMKSQ